MLKNYFFPLFSLLIMNFANAQSGNALDLDGTNDYITFNVPTIFNNVATQDFTIEARIKPTTFTTNRVFFVQTTTSNYVSIMINSTGKVYAYINGTTNPSSSGSLTLNAWNHIAITRSVSTSETLIYINGVLQTTTSGGSTSYGTVNLMAIGAKTDGTQLFKGTIDEFRIWNTVRTAAQITANMDSEVTPQTGLVSYYKCNQGIANGNNASVTTLNDEFTTINGTLLNFALSGTTSNWVGTSSLSTKEINFHSSLSLTPNPAVNEVKILGLKQRTEYTIFNAGGQFIKTGNVDKENNIIEVSELNKGVYFINLGEEKMKLIKK
ncbi:LamG-like jellyroll fold domain-containing protein [Chryseobacterium gwangjuense]|uniref:LamG-like jellyroll fold domain-containing protein n=1 Tax=Chryseobacterium gwangjuense TaxID=1069980 RepID=UPI001E52B7CE|nr:LamG-like jellyroll fold domain-containing protein [Chryseobacterium gwangjuense]MCE3074788.1 T9SS type A sorting domain-containing protein [Chryseobacterium gwangjuense]